jgi:hypothetical protein
LDYEKGNMRLVESIWVYCFLVFLVVGLFRYLPVRLAISGAALVGIGARLWIEAWRAPWGYCGESINHATMEGDVPFWNWWYGY